MPTSESPVGVTAGLLPWQLAIWQRLLDRYASGRLPHALLLHGLPGLGKKRFAAHVAQALVCEDSTAQHRPCGHCRSCRLASAGSHPDIRWVTPDENGKAIKVDAVREACSQSVLTADGEHHRVFVFAPAEQLNAAAANALLKTLEEPVARTVIMLVCNAPHRLPATIRSRCQQIPFRAPSELEALAWVNGDADPEAFREALALAGGAPLEAQARLEQGIPERVRGMRDDLFALAERRAGPVEIAAQWQALQSGQILELLQFWLIDLIRLKTGPQPPICYFDAAKARLQTLAERIDCRALFGLLDRLHEAQRASMNNLNPQMLTEHLLIDWCNTSQSGKS